MSFAVLVHHMLLACTFLPSIQQGGLVSGKRIRNPHLSVAFADNITAGWPFTTSVSTVSSAGIEPNVTLTGYLAEVQATLQSLESKPICSRIAHKTLLNACGKYDGRNNQVFRSTDEAVKTFRDLFAIQITACEMDDARQAMPASCQPLLGPLSQDPRDDISNCLSSLHDLVNPWTSYRHNKDAGDVMCYAMRAQMDTGEQLNDLRKLISVLEAIGYIVRDHGMSLEQLLQVTENLGSKLGDVFAAIQHEQQKLSAEVIQSFSKIQKDVSLMGEGVSSLRNSVGEVDHELQKHMGHVNNIFDRMMSLGTTVDTWTTGVTVAREEFGELQARMQMQMQQVLENVFKGVYELTAEVSRANEGVSSFAELVVAINDGIDGTFATLQGVNIAAGDAQHKIRGISKTLEDIAVQTNSTQETMQLVNDHVEKMQSWVMIASTLLEGFISTMKCLKQFGLYYAMGTGLIMLCLSWLGVKLLNATLISALLGYRKF